MLGLDLCNGTVKITHHRMHMSHESAYRREWDSLFQTHNVFLSSQSRDWAPDLSSFRSKWILALYECVRDVESLSIRERCWAHSGLRTGEARIQPALCAALLNDTHMLVRAPSTQSPRGQANFVRAFGASWLVKPSCQSGNGSLIHIWARRGRGYYVAPF